MGLTKTISKDNLKIKFTRAGFKPICKSKKFVNFEILKDNCEINIFEDSLELIGLYQIEFHFKDIKGLNLMVSKFKIYVNIFLFTGEQLIYSMPIKKMTKNRLEKNLNTSLFLREVKKGEKIIIEND